MTRLFLCHDYKAPGRDHVAEANGVRYLKVPVKFNDEYAASA